MKPTTAQRRLLMRLAEGNKTWKLRVSYGIDSHYLFLDPSAPLGARTWENVHLNTWWACDKRGWLKVLSKDWRSAVYTISEAGRKAIE